MSEPSASERLPAPSSSREAAARPRLRTGFGHFLATTGLLDWSVVAGWEQCYADELSERSQPLDAEF